MLFLQKVYFCVFIISRYNSWALVFVISVYSSLVVTPRELSWALVFVISVYSFICRYNSWAFVSSRIRYFCVHHYSLHLVSSRVFSFRPKDSNESWISWSLKLNCTLTLWAENWKVFFAIISVVYTVHPAACILLPYFKNSWLGPSALLIWAIYACCVMQKGIDTSCFLFCFVS